MKDFGKDKARTYWKKLMDSTHHAISRGAANIYRIITVAHGNQWRRNEGAKHPTPRMKIHKH